MKKFIVLNVSKDNKKRVLMYPGSGEVITSKEIADALNEIGDIHALSLVGLNVNELDELVNCRIKNLSINNHSKDLNLDNFLASSSKINIFSIKSRFMPKGHFLKSITNATFRVVDIDIADLTPSENVELQKVILKHYQTETEPLEFGTVIHANVKDVTAESVNNGLVGEIIHTDDFSYLDDNKVHDVVNYHGNFESSEPMIYTLAGKSINQLNITADMCDDVAVPLGALSKVNDIEIHTNSMCLIDTDVKLTADTLRLSAEEHISGLYWGDDVKADSIDLGMFAGVRKTLALTNVESILPGSVLKLNRNLESLLLSTKSISTLDLREFKKLKSLVLANSDAKLPTSTSGDVLTMALHDSLVLNHSKALFDNLFEGKRLVAIIVTVLTTLDDMKVVKSIILTLREILESNNSANIELTVNSELKPYLPQDIKDRCLYIG